MGTRAQERLHKIEEFDAAHAGVVGALQSTLIRRPLKASELDCARSHLDDRFASGEDIWWPHVADTGAGRSDAHFRKRFIHASWAYMAPLMRNADAAVVGTEFMEISYRQIISIRRNLPLIVSRSHHVEERHVRRAHERLDYGHSDMVASLSFVLPICAAMIPERAQNPDAKWPVALPHPKGFFLGELQANRPFEEASAGAHPLPPQAPYFGDIKGSSLRSPVALHLYTFLQKSLFKSVQWQLYEGFRPFLEHERRRAVLRQGLDLFSSGPLLTSRASPQALNEWNDVCQEVGKVCASPAWRGQREKSLLHLEKREAQNKQGRPDQKIHVGLG